MHLEEIFKLLQYFMLPLPGSEIKIGNWKMGWNEYDNADECAVAREKKNHYQ